MAFVIGRAGHDAMLAERVPVLPFSDRNHSMSVSGRSGFPKRKQHAANQKADCYAQRYFGWHFTHHVMKENFRAYKDKHQSQRIFKVNKATDHGSQCKIERSQAENGKNIRRINDERILCDSKNRRYAVNSKYQICTLNLNKCKEERCHP